MLRSLIFFSLALAGRAAILTDNLGNSKRVSLDKVKVSDAAIWDEYGLTDAETGKYEGTGGKPFTATAWRMRDPTGSQAVFRWLRPAEAKPGNKDALYYSQFAAAWPGNVLMTHGNYVIRFEGSVPAMDELKIFLFQLPKVDQSSLPPLLEYVPKQGLVAGSDRFISGPASLEKFYNRIPPSTVGFHFGTEALTGRYRTGSGEMEMAVFYYPANAMARERLPEFQKIPGAMVKRSGPLLAMIVNPSSADDAERLLAQVNYQVQVTINEGKPGSQIRNAGDLLIAIFQLTGVILAITVVAGIMVFVMRVLRRKAAGGRDEDPMTMLNLGGRQ